MNKKEVLEIRRQFSPDNCAISRICGCYVDHEKEKKMEFKKAFLSLPEEEAFKYFDIFRRTLSGTLGKNLINMEFPLEQEVPGGTQEFLLKLRDSRLEDWLALTEKEGFRAHRMYFGESGKLPPQALGVFGELNAAIEDTFGAFPEEGGRGEFSMRELVEEKGGRVLFLEYDIALGEGQQPLFRLWFDLGLKFSLGGRGENRGRTFFICDELSLLPDLRHLADALNFGRSRGVRMLCALQSVNQFCDAYGPQADSILAGFCSCFGFRCYDDASRTYLSRRLGRQYAALAIRTAGGQLAPQAREGRVAEDWVVRALATGEALVDLAGDAPHPFRFRFSPHP